MSLEGLPTIITLLIALSVATERTVEIVKSMVPWLDTARPVKSMEGFRRAALHALGVVAGIGITWLTWPIVAQILGQTEANVHLPTVAALGLLASGGSGFWNSMLTYAVNLKELKRADVREHSARVAALATPQPDEGQLQP